MPSKTPPGSEGSSNNESIAELQREVADLRTVIEGLVRASALECIVERGFEELAERLAPLRELAPPRTRLEGPEAEELRAMRAALMRPDFSRPQLKSAATDQYVRGMGVADQLLETSEIPARTSSGRSAS
jgi:hypothetical protein